MFSQLSRDISQMPPFKRCCYECFSGEIIYLRITFVLKVFITHLILFKRYKQFDIRFCVLPTFSIQRGTVVFSKIRPNKKAKYY